jgi:hypothetical protein
MTVVKLSNVPIMYNLSEKLRRRDHSIGWQGRGRANMGR